MGAKCLARGGSVSPHALPRLVGYSTRTSEEAAATLGRVPHCSPTWIRTKDNWSRTSRVAATLSENSDSNSTEENGHCYHSTPSEDDPQLSHCLSVFFVHDSSLTRTEEEVNDGGRGPGSRLPGTSDSSPDLYRRVLLTGFSASHLLSLCPLRELNPRREP